MKALYAGSFDPFTLGHLDIALRASQIFDEVIIGIAINLEKKSSADTKIRKEIVRLSLNSSQNVSYDEKLEIFQHNHQNSPKNNIKIEEYFGLTTDFALKTGCGVIVRGVRNVIDYEKEKELALIYKNLSGIETIFLPANPQLLHISSSATKELIHFNKEIDNFVAKDAKNLIISTYKKS